MTLTPEDMLVKARVKLQKESPFFSYLVMNLHLIEEKAIPTVGVDNKGNLAFNPEFVKTVYKDGGVKALQTILAHEVLHLVYEHHDRIKNRHKEKSNVAMDLVVNYSLLVNGFSFDFLKKIGFGIIPTKPKYDSEDYCWDYYINGKKGKIEKVNEKSFEQVYNELPEPIKVNCFGGGFCEKGKGEAGESLKECEGIDNHERLRDEKSNDKNKGAGDKQKDSLQGKDEPQGEGESQGNDKDWRQVLLDAYNKAKMKGELPAGMDRIVNEIVEGRVNWKSLLYTYLVREVPYDFSWSKFHRKSVSIQSPLPYVEKEGIDIVVSVDTSGSISNKTMSEFVGEIVSIARSFEWVTMTLLVCDAEIHQTFVVGNGNLTEIMDLARKGKFKGGGGTSHEPIVKWIKKHKPDAKCLVALTDGYSDIEQCFHKLGIDKIIVLNTNSVEPETLKAYGRVIKIQD